MGYSVFFKHFNILRGLIREFYVYGYKSREEYDERSKRTYSDRKRQVESYLEDNVKAKHNDSKRKAVFIPIDTRERKGNPLYRTWKGKCVTDKAIVLHFFLFDILDDSRKKYTVKGIVDEIEERLKDFDANLCDESSVRKKLTEYEKKGLICGEKEKRVLNYRRAEMVKPYGTNVLDFFSEVMPCGVIGSYLLDEGEQRVRSFGFKHHYITGALDSEVMYQLFEAMHKRVEVTLTLKRNEKEAGKECLVIPLRILISVQNGRQYLMTFVPERCRIERFRLDHIWAVAEGSVCQRFEELRRELQRVLSNVWGVSTANSTGEKLEYVEFVVKYDSNSIYIHNRLEREKRCGTVERIDDCRSRFSAALHDSRELVPWMRTFIGRIVEVNFSNKELEQEFTEDIKEMYRMYGLEGGES